MKKNAKGETALDLASAFVTNDIFFDKKVFLKEYEQTRGLVTYDSLSESDSEETIFNI